MTLTFSPETNRNAPLAHAYWSSIHAKWFQKVAPWKTIDNLYTCNVHLHKFDSCLMLVGSLCCVEACNFPSVTQYIPKFDSCLMLVALFTVL